MIRIRTLGAKDCDALLALFEVLNTGKPVRLQDGAAARFEALITHPGTSVFGLETEAGLVATTTLHLLPNMTNGGRCYGLIENVATRSSLQGQGYGRKVMQAAIDKAWSENAYKIMLLTGRANEARRFYEKLGFSADEKWGMVLRASA